MTSSNSTIKLLTLNTWGLKLVSRHRRQRLKAIADRLSASEYSVVALQEVWCQSDWDYIVKKNPQFTFKRWFYSGIIAGPGLAILSKHVVRETFLYRFPINGRPSAFWRGDWYVGKSASVTILEIEEGDKVGVRTVAVVNSHLHAPYALSGDANYECHRTLQAYDMSKLVSLLRKAGHAVIVVGDLNSRPGENSYSLITDTGLSDSWENVHGSVDLQMLKSMNPREQVKVGGVTCDSILNTWRADRQPWEACRLDYALIDGSKLLTKRAKVVFDDYIEGIGSYSDHFGYEVVLELTDNLNVTPKISIEERLSTHRALLEIIENYKATSIWQMRWRVTHFFCSIVVLLCIFIASTFTSMVSPWSSVFWVIGATVISVTGVINGIIGWIFGRYEWRQLMESEQEVEDAIHYFELKLMRTKNNRTNTTSKYKDEDERTLEAN